MIRRTCAAVRAGRSRLSVAASDRICGAVTGPWVRPWGLSASNPPRRQNRIDRSMVSFRDNHGATERARVLPLRQRAHHRATLPGRHALVGSLPDQLVAEQRDLLHPLPAGGRLTRQGLTHLWGFLSDTPVTGM